MDMTTTTLASLLTLLALESNADAGMYQFTTIDVPGVP